MKQKSAFAVAALSSVSILAATNTWTGAVNDWDWNEAGNFSKGVPAQGDVVEVPAGVTVQVKDAGAVSVVSSLAQLRLLEEDGKEDGTVVFDLEEGDYSVSCAIGETVKSEYAGKIIKRGTGSLSLANTGTYAYMAGISIEEGVLRTYSEEFAPMYIAAGATLVTSPDGVTLLHGLSGSGLITNETTASYCNFKINGDADFSGRIAGKIYYQSSGMVMLRGTDNVFEEDFSIYNTSTGVRDFEELVARGIGYTGVMKLGLKGAPSSVGIDNDIRTIDYGGGLLYLGEGETTDRNFSVFRPNRGLSFIDGGATGGLVWSGTIAVEGTASNNGMGILGLLGSNNTPCVIAGPVSGRTYGGTNYCFFFEKAGSGIWRFADAPDNRTDRTFWTSMAVKNGTLQFDSMEEAGVPCALGLATNLTALYYGARNDAAHPGPYAYWLGAPGKTVTFEFTGTNGAYATKRPIALDGDAWLKNDTPHPWRFSGVSPTTDGAKVLGLCGSGAGESEIAGISETKDSPVSVVKDGSGIWTLNGSNTFSGKVSVKAGILRVRRDPGHYTWFRWTIRNKNASTASYLYLPELSLSDEEGERVNVGLSFTNNWCGTLPGQISLPRVGSYAISSERYIVNLVDGETSVVNISYHMGYDADGKPKLQSPVESKPDTHIPVLMRLPEGGSPAKYYDVCIHSNTNGKNNPNSWTLEGSADGIHWDLLDDVSGLGLPENTLWWHFAGYQYYVSSTKVKTESKTNGKEISLRPAGRISSAFSNTVSVAAGATLKAIGEVVLSSVEIDASDAGTIDGFSFAASGELNVRNFSANGTLPGTFADAEGGENLKNWSVSVNGTHAPGKTVSLSASGTLSIVSRGFMFTVR